MVEKIINSSDEINAAAEHLRQTGNVDALRKLAKDKAVPYQQTEDYIQGKRYRLVEIPIAEKEFHSAAEKLREEMMTLDDPHFANPVAWHIVKRCGEEEGMGRQVLQKHKSLQRCLDYITGKAFEIVQKQAKEKGQERIEANTGLALTEKEVFPWAEEYYRKSDEEEVKKAVAEERQKILAEWNQKEGKAAGSGKTVSAKKTGTRKKKKTEEAPKISEKGELFSSEHGNAALGQISLFDLPQ